MDIEFHTRRDGTQMVAVKVGNSMVAMESSEWLEFAHGVIREIEAHLTQRAPDEGYCAHDWSFPPEFCPVCNKRVPLIRLRG